MCGIVGYIGGSADNHTRHDVLRRMADAIIHRGPDDHGYHVASGVGLGMRRLSIIDVAHGQQPMMSEDGRWCLVFNGEIYNFQVLRSRLETLGHNFRTASDTEVLLHMLRTEGTEALLSLNGMFGFALWDNQERTLLLGRDRMGVKPLYYSWDGQRLLFASEIKALIASGLVNRQLEMNALWDYLTFRYIPAPRTVWHKVCKLPAGHLLTYIPEKNDLQIVRYWDIPYETRRRNPSKSLDDKTIDLEFSKLFEDAVRLRLIADVPVGLLLSGGLDSSAVAVAAMANGAKLETFSIGFSGEEDANELKFARQVAEHLGNPHHEIEINHQDFIEFLPNFVRSIDEPMADPASIPLYYVCKLASERVKVILSGEGSDEILGGYDFDLWVQAWERQRLVSTSPAKSGVVGALWRRFFPKDYPPVDLRLGWPPPNMTNYMDSEAKKTLFGTDCAFEDSLKVIAADLARLGTQPTLHQMLYVFSQSWLTEDLLMKADKMSMAASLELRTPFLDYRLVEWAARTDPKIKVGPGRDGRLVTKRILRRYAENRLPRTIIDRPKQGFPVPLYAWLTERLSDWVEDVLFGSEARLIRRFNVKELRELFSLGTDPNSGILDKHRLWNLLVLELWMREWHPL